MRRFTLQRRTHACAHGRTHALDPRTRARTHTHPHIHPHPPTQSPTHPRTRTHPPTQQLGTQRLRFSHDSLPSILCRDSSDTQTPCVRNVALFGPTPRLQRGFCSCTRGGTLGRGGATRQSCRSGRSRQSMGWEKRSLHRLVIYALGGPPFRCCRRSHQINSCDFSGRPAGLAREILIIRRGFTSSSGPCLL